MSLRYRLLLPLSVLWLTLSPTVWPSDVITSGSMSLPGTLARLSVDKGLQAAAVQESRVPPLFVYEHIHFPNLEIIAHVDETLEPLPGKWFDNRVAPRFRAVDPEQRHVRIPRHENDLAAIGRALEEAWDVESLVLPAVNALVLIEVRDGKRIDSLLDRVVDPREVAGPLTFEEARTLLREKYGMCDAGYEWTQRPAAKGRSFLGCDCPDDIVWSGSNDTKEVRVRDLALALWSRAAVKAGNADAGRLISGPGSTWSFGK